MKKSFIILLTVLIMLGGFLISDKYTTSTNAVATSEPKNQIEKIVRDSVSENLNIDIEESEEIVKLDKDEAIKRGKEIMGDTYSDKASSITAELSRFTDKQIKKLPNSDISTQDIPAWIVTLHDVEAVSHGGYNQSNDSKIITDMNVVINANTGEEVEAFSYK